MKRSAHGVTVVELMVTVAVGAILIGFAIPGMIGFVTQQGFTGAANDMVVALNVARSEALRQRGIVTVQSIDASDTDDEWGQGWCVTSGDPGDCSTPLRVFEELGDVTLNGGLGFNAIDSISFDSRGMMTLGAAGQFDLCHPTRGPGRRITVSPIGRPSIADLACP